MLSVTGNADVEGTIATCPCAPATEAKGTFVADFKAEYNADAGCLRRRGVRRDEHLPGGASRRARRPAPTSRPSSPSYNKAGPATGVTYKWDAKGELEPDQVTVWAYKAKRPVGARQGDPEGLTDVGRLGQPAVRS